MTVSEKKKQFSLGGQEDFVKIGVALQQQNAYKPSQQQQKRARSKNDVPNTNISMFDPSNPLFNSGGDPELNQHYYSNETKTAANFLQQLSAQQHANQRFTPIAIGHHMTSIGTNGYNQTRLGNQATHHMTV